MALLTQSQLQKAIERKLQCPWRSAAQFAAQIVDRFSDADNKVDSSMIDEYLRRMRERSLDRRGLGYAGRPADQYQGSMGEEWYKA